MIGAVPLATTERTTLLFAHAVTSKRSVVIVGGESTVRVAAALVATPQRLVITTS